MFVFFAIFSAKLLDPLAFLLCAGTAAFLGIYRVAVPVGALIYGALYLGLSDKSSLESFFASALAGAVFSTIGLFAWSKVPNGFKRAMVRQAAQESDKADH